MVWLLYCCLWHKLGLQLVEFSTFPENRMLIFHFQFRKVISQFCYHGIQDNKMYKVLGGHFIFACTALITNYSRKLGCHMLVPVCLSFLHYGQHYCSCKQIYDYLCIVFILCTSDECETLISFIPVCIYSLNSGKL